MNEEIQPKQKKRGRPRKIQQQSLSSDKTVSPEVEKEIRSKMVNVEGGQWQCVDCSYTSKFNNVHKHVEAKHVTEKNSYECPICHRVKNGLNSFSNHIYRFHKNENFKESLQKTGGGPEKKKKITEVKEQKAGSKSGGRRKTAAAKSGGRTKKAPKKSGKTVKISLASKEPKGRVHYIILVKSLNWVQPMPPTPLDISRVVRIQKALNKVQKGFP